MSERSDPPQDDGLAVRLVARVLLAVILIGGPIVLGWVAIDLLSVRQSLVTARSAMAEVRGALGEVDIDEAQRSLATASEELDDATRRAGRFSWTIASEVPYLGPTVTVTREVIEVADAAVEIAELTVTDGQQLLAQGFDVAVVDGHVDLQPVLDARDLVAAMPIERLVTARDRLAAPQEAWLPDVVKDGRADVLVLADDTLATLQRAEALTAALPGFLGVDGERRYFIGMQTSAELRGTGGLIGFWGVLSVDDGRATFGAGEAYDPFDDAGLPEGETRVDRIRSIGLSPVNPPDVDEAFLGRYATTAAARSFPNVNLDPDLPTVGKAILDLFELQTGERLDGVVLLDPPGVERLLEPTGDTLPVSADVAAEVGLDDGLPVDAFARFTTDEIYDTFGFDRSDDRKELLRELGDTAFGRIFAGGWSTPDMVRAIAEATTERHLQVYSTDEEVQAGFHAVNATGSLELPEDADLLALTANNVVGGKQDVHLGHRSDVEVVLDEVQIGADGSVWALRWFGVSVHVDNPLPASGRDLYVIGNCYVPDAVNRCFEGEPGTNRTWFSLWMSPQSRTTRFLSEDGTPPTRIAGTFRDLRVIDHFLLTPSEGASGFTVEAAGRVPLRRDLDSVVYELQWWRQAKAIPDLLDVTVTPPPGWAIGDVEVVGGGSGRGMGVHGEGVDRVVEVVDGVAHVRGTFTADTRLLVHLIDPADVDDQS
ncbi:MAG: DUF4012 domain-containing protein [Nitriliruptor sp.]|nr:MAG: DUF4012 domain-containing protein [Nitriliruptor sp.]